MLSFAFQRRAAAVDGNVVRVLSRFFATNKDASQKKHYEELALAILPAEEPWISMEGLIELGAQVCQRRPKCGACPLRADCKAYRHGETELYPVKKKRPATIYLERQVAVIRWEKEYLVRQEQGKKVMAGLYEFPYAPIKEALPVELVLKKLRDLPLVKHGFTRYDVTLYPSLYQAVERGRAEGFEWKSWEELGKLPFSSGHKRILELLNNENITH